MANDTQGKTPEKTPGMVTWMQECGERDGRSMGFSDQPVETSDPLKTCADRIWYYVTVGVRFNAHSRSTDRIAVTVYQKPENWAELEAQGQSVAREPLQTVVYDKNGISVKTPQMIA